MAIKKLARSPSSVQTTLAACVWMVATACASPQRPPAQSAGAPSPAPKVRAPTADAKASTTPSARPVAEELERLARSVRALEDSADDPEHLRVVRSLRDAADALAEIEPTRDGGDDTLRAAAEHIDASGASSLSHADELRTALVAALEKLRAHGAGTAQATAFSAALADLGRGVDTLSPTRPLLEQQPAVSRSFRALTEALFLLAGHDAPFAGRAPEPRSVSEVLEQARADVLALGRADLSNIRALTARTMYSMAELAEAVAGRDAAGSRVADIRAEARRLEHDSSGPFARTGWVERGLQAALDALDQLDVCHEPLVVSWTEAARRSARALPERGALPFQHAAVQDAFRATLDAIGVAVLDDEGCHTPTRRSGRESISAYQPASAR